METLRTGLAVAHVVLLGLLALLAGHRLFLVGLLARHRAAPPVSPAPPIAVTVQLPIYNEATVAARLLDAVAALRWPRELLEVQVLDDSTDETSRIVSEKVAALSSIITVHHIRREERTGFKAGALAAGLESARGEVVAIFDADFVPEPGFLEKTVPCFQDPRIGLVQARWDHENRTASLLTRLQALLLDGHFVVEQAARARSGRPFKFNGTAGIFRKQAIVDAGGWSADTLTEDFDLSIRAQLAGWKFAFREDAIATGELPETLAAFRSQQQRWVRGSAQTARKLLGRVWRSPLSLRDRVETTIQLSVNATYPLSLALALLSVPLVAFTKRPWVVDRWLLAAATLSVAVYLLASQARRGLRACLEALVLTPAVFALGLGISLANARAFVLGLLDRKAPFVRTPKRGARYRPDVAWREPIVEVALAAYAMVGIASSRHIAGIPFLSLVLTGFLAVGTITLATSFKTKFRVTDSLT